MGGKGKTRYFLQSPVNLSLAQRVQWTQGSEYPTGENYAPFEKVAADLVVRFGSSIKTETDWWAKLVANNWEEAKQEVSKVASDNARWVYDSLLRDLGARIGALEEIQWFHDGNGTRIYAYGSVNEATHNKVDELLVKVNALTEALTEKENKA